MREVSSRNFGLLMAYLLPGFVTLWGFSGVSGDVRAWLLGAGPSGPSVGGFLYVTVGSAACGLAVSVVRWALVDSLHHLTGLRRPRWNDALLGARQQAYELLIEIHYRYYQFSANMLVALLLAYGPVRMTLWRGALWWDAAFVLMEALLFAGSRDALRKYYERVERLLETEGTETDDDQRRPARADRQAGPEA